MKFLQKTIPIIYGIMFTIILVLLFVFSGVDYHLKKSFIISNIMVLIFFIFPIFWIYYLYKKKRKDISDKKYKIILICIASLVFIVQLILTKCIYFYTDWDVGVIRDIVDYYFVTGNINGNFYLSTYPNNLLLVMLIVIIKSVPIFGKHYMFLLGINCFFVNLAGIFTSLTIKNIINKRVALQSFIITIPFILLSPWIVIPYTDTFGILFPILVFYLYTKKERRIIDYYLIGLFTFIGYYIKPTVAIILMAIVIVEIISNGKQLIKKENIKNNLKVVGLAAFGIFSAVLVFKSSYYILNFEPAFDVKPTTFIHYLAMGQNEETLGAYSQQDINETGIYGAKADLKKFYKRLTGRTFGGQIEFFSKKTLLNFNDGSFSWASEGTFFYKINETKSSFAKLLRKIYYNNGKYNLYFLQFCQIIWLTVLFFCTFIIKKKNNKNELVIMLSIIGITMFLTIFEPRTRYLYCYSPIFVICALIGLSNLYEIVNKKVKSFKKKKC